MVISQKEYVRIISEALELVSIGDADSFDSDLEFCTEEQLNESSLSRIASHLDKSKPVLMLTAHRAPVGSHKTVQRMKAENKHNNRILKKQLHQQGFGITNLYGKYNETGDDGVSREVKEHSFLVTGKPGEGEKLFRTGKALGAAYGQNSILFKDEGTHEAYLHSTSKPGVVNSSSWLDTMPDKKFNVGQYAPGVKNPDGSSELHGVSFSFLNKNPPAQ